MSKKIRSILTLFLLTLFIVSSLNITAASGSAYYSLRNARSLSRASTFSPYKAVITTKVLNIRKSPSTTGAIVGTYKSGSVIDIIGQSGSYLKTSKGYIMGTYTKKYTTITPSRGTTSISFQTYKVVITTSKLNIRKSASTSAAITGYYTKGTIVDVTGVSASFLKTSKGYISSAYTQKYTPPSTGTAPTVPTTPSTGVTTGFQPYKASITTAKLNIRTGPGTNYSLAGYYTKSTIVDVTGVSGSFLKTSKGYVSSAYTQRYTAASTGTTPTVPTTPSTGTTPTVPATPSTGTTPTVPTTPSTGETTGFQSYKVTITTSKLNIRKGPSASTTLVGTYSGGSIVDITGQSGSFLLTPKGYIAAGYTQRYTVPNIPSRGDTDIPVVITGYIQVKENTPLLINVDGATDERYAVVGKTYGVVAQTGDYYKIKIGKMYGYIPSSKVTVVTTTPKNKVSLAWQYVYAKSSNATYYNDASNYVNKSSADLGLDVISPSWFYMTGDAGSPSTINAAEKADSQYTKIAHKNGYEVWALYQEFNKDRAYKTFYDPTVKARVISQIVNFALQYNVDGVNIDYEGIGGIAANKEGFTAFVRDLTTQLKAIGLNVSVDVVKPTVGSVYSSFTDRPALASYVDYIVYMAYDEHYAGAKTAGSVGSFPWVEKGLKDTIAQGVSKDKIILGVPFYLRDFTVLNTFQPYDTVLFSQDGSLYTKPFDYGNKLIDINPGYTYKYLETVSDWYKVELEGDTAYIPKNDSVYAGANTNLNQANTSQNIVFPYDTVVMKEQSNVYSQPSQTAGIIGSINPGYAYKIIEVTQDWFKINYNGTEAYIMQKSGAFLPQFTSSEDPEVSTGIMVPYETVIIKSETGLYKQPTGAESEKAVNVKVGESFRHIGTAPGMPDWYIVDYKGAQVYAQKSYTSFISANTASNLAAVKSSAVSLQSTLDKVGKYGGRTYYDETAKQNVAQYFADGYWHMVWLEDTLSMGWRMDLINDYGLAGTGGWDLNWNPSADIYNVIKSKLK